MSWRGLWAIRFTIFSLFALNAAQAQNAYTPSEKTVSVTPAYSYQTFSSFRSSKESIKLRDVGIDHIEQSAFTVSADYGITNDIAADVSLGYVNSHSDGVLVPGDPSTIDGLNDTLLGIRWRFVDEAQSESLWVPTVTARVGAILAGTYEAGYINSPGDGAFGMENSLLIARYYERIGFGYYGNATYRVRGDVPDEFVGQVGIYKTLFNDFTLSFGYRRLQSLSGINFDSPQFTLDRFQDLNEISDIIDYSLSYTDPGGRSYNLGFGNVIGGKNVGQSFILNISATLSF